MTLVTRRSFVTLIQDVLVKVEQRAHFMSFNLQNFNYAYLAKAAEEERDDYSKNISTIFYLTCTLYFILAITGSYTFMYKYYHIQSHA